MSAEKGIRTVALPADLYLPEDESLSAGTEILRCAQNDEFGGMGSAICYLLSAIRFRQTGIYRHAITYYSYRDSSLSLRMTSPAGRRPADSGQR